MILPNKPLLKSKVPHGKSCAVNWSWHKVVLKVFQKIDRLISLHFSSPKIDFLYFQTTLVHGTVNFKFRILDFFRNLKIKSEVISPAVPERIFCGFLALCIFNI